MAAPHISLPAALLQQPANSGKCRQRGLPEIVDIVRGKAGRFPEGGGIVLDDCRDRIDPGFGRRERRHGVGGRDRVGDGVDEIGIKRSGLGQMVDGLALVETAHFDRIFDRHTLAVDIKRSIVALRDRNDATVDLRRELAVDFDLFVAGCFPFLERRIIEKGKADRALDLQRAVAFEKNRRRMGIDPMNMRMRRRIGQKCEDALLRGGAGCR